MGSIALINSFSELLRCLFSLPLLGAKHTPPCSWQHLPCLSQKDDPSAGEKAGKHCEPLISLFVFLSI